MAVIRVIGAGALAALMAEERTCASPHEAQAMDRRRLAGRRKNEKAERDFKAPAPAGGTPAVHIAR